MIELVQEAGELVLSDDIIGKALKEVREEHGVIQKDLAESPDMSPSVISDYESGRRKSPGAGFLKRYLLGLKLLREKRKSSRWTSLIFYRNPCNQFDARKRHYTST